MSLENFYEAIGNARLVLSPQEDIVFQLKDLEEVFSALKRYEVSNTRLIEENKKLKEDYNKQKDTLNFLRGLITIKPPSIRDFVVVNKEI